MLPLQIIGSPAWMHQRQFNVQKTRWVGRLVLEELLSALVSLTLLCLCLAFAHSDVSYPALSQAILRNIQTSLPEAALRACIDSLIQHVIEYVIRHTKRAMSAIELWTTKVTTRLSAQLDQMLQHHRPKVVDLMEVCEQTVSKLRGIDHSLADFMLMQSGRIATQECTT